MSNNKVPELNTVIQATAIAAGSEGAIKGQLTLLNEIKSGVIENYRNQAKVSLDAMQLKKKDRKKVEALVEGILNGLEVYCDGKGREIEKETNNLKMRIDAQVKLVEAIRPAVESGSKGANAALSLKALGKKLLK